MERVNPSGGEAREVAVHTRGDVSAADREYAQNKVGHLQSLARGPVLFAQVDLTAHADPARERPASAKAELDVDGRLVRAHVAAATMHEAVDLLEDRLRVRLERLAHHEESKHLRHRGGEEHQWRHGDEPTPRPSYFPRPLEERELVRHKTFAVGMMTPDDAVVELELLDHDFYLFTNRETGEDNVVARSDEGGYDLLEPSETCALRDMVAPVRHRDVRPPTMDVDDARQLLDLGDLPFLFFVDAQTHRGHVLYRRYDGHYGLIVPSDAGPSSL